MAVNLNFTVTINDLKEILKRVKLKGKFKKENEENEKNLRKVIISFYKASSFAIELSKKENLQLDLYYPSELMNPKNTWEKFKTTNKLISIPISLELCIDQLCDKFCMETLSSQQYKEVSIYFKQIADDFELQYEQLNT
ncbi:hypothetical protein CN326_20705 [Bacillus sp. AFS018417]|uniref:hypothetical protein n=1 Tax=Bacillus sp. AFS018417 TaxID=2033491 RepID=UPI000BF776E0|nr:hypothetical protein [Bacillus sp. AFS018417]PEZ01822.1 hypothetical protein CN326_20705 [Bacillus sp. AFS018417]